MRSIWTTKWISLLFALSLLTACGGGGGSTAGGGGGTYSISGTVTSGGTAFQGVTMTLSGAGGAITTTDGSGNYAVNGLAPGSYVVTPSKTNYTFTQPITVTIMNVDTPGVNFHALLQVVTCPTTTVPSVSIGGAGYNPTITTVTAPQIVKWTNWDNLNNHTVTSGFNRTFDGKFDSGPLSFSQTFCVNFIAGGGNQYDYFSSPSADSSLAGGVVNVP